MNKWFRRPVLSAVAVFLLTIGITRFLNYFWPPLFHVHFGRGVHIHHYVFGIFMITIAGFLALVFKGPRATFGISLLYAFGVGFTFDEFGFWVNPPYRLGSSVRWDNTGLLIIGGAFALITAARLLSRARRRHARQSAGEVPNDAARQVVPPTSSMKR